MTNVTRKFITSVTEEVTFVTGRFLQISITIQLPRMVKLALGTYGREHQTNNANFFGKSSINRKGKVK